MFTSFTVLIRLLAGGLTSFNMPGADWVSNNYYYHDGSIIDSDNSGNITGTAASNIAGIVPATNFNEHTTQTACTNAGGTWVSDSSTCRAWDTNIWVLPSADNDYLGGLKFGSCTHQPVEVRDNNSALIGYEINKTGDCP